VSTDLTSVWFGFYALIFVGNFIIICSNVKCNLWQLFSLPQPSNNAQRSIARQNQSNEKEIQTFVKYVLAHANNSERFRTVSFYRASA